MSCQTVQWRLFLLWILEKHLHGAMTQATQKSSSHLIAGHSPVHNGSTFNQLPLFTPKWDTRALLAADDANLLHGLGWRGWLVSFPCLHQPPPGLGWNGVVWR